MGHALKEVWRLLSTGGTLIDLRPIAAHWPIDVLIKGSALPVGTIDGTLRTPHDNASNRAMAAAVRKGQFKKEGEAYFEFAYYWDSLDELKAYVDNCWSDTAVLPESAIAQVHRLVMANPTQPKIRIRRQMMIARYHRL